MPTFHFEAEVKDDRQIVIMLPPEVPLGKADLVVSIAAAETSSAGSRSSLAAWAEANAEPWGKTLRSTDVEGFTGRAV